MKKKALILTWDSFQDHEVIYPFYRVQEDSIDVDIMSDKLGRIHGILGVYMESTKSVFVCPMEKNCKTSFNKLPRGFVSS